MSFLKLRKQPHIINFFFSSYHCLFEILRLVIPDLPCESNAGKALKKKLHFRHFRPFLANAEIVARGDFYAENYTNLSTFKEQKQIPENRFTARQIYRAMKHTRGFCKYKRK
jgi:hypothetical protein